MPYAIDAVEPAEKLEIAIKLADLTHSADAQKYYTRLKNAARVVCTHGNRLLGLVRRAYLDQRESSPLRSGPARLARVE
jgi:UrcA family protein